jgi:hypothetical protein
LNLLSADGKPYSVKYHALPALLLNEMQEQQRTIVAQRHEHEKEIGALTTRLARVETRVIGAPARRAAERAVIR